MTQNKTCDQSKTNNMEKNIKI